MKQALREEKWPILRKDDDALMKTLEATLTKRAKGDPYDSRGSFSACIAKLPVGLRAMAATHWLDISLSMDSMTCHFGNFGEPGLVAQTEEGLLELGLPEMAECFHEAAEFMVPLLARMNEGEDPAEGLERLGLTEQADRIDRRGMELKDSADGGSVIYEAWIPYARKHPERVFGS